MLFGASAPGGIAFAIKEAKGGQGGTWIRSVRSKATRAGMRKQEAFPFLGGVLDAMLG